MARPTRKDYRLVAGAVKAVHDQGPPISQGAAEVAYKIADTFGQTYPNFNKVRFLDFVFSDEPVRQLDN